MVPMGFFVELFFYIFSLVSMRKVKKITGAIAEIAKGNYDVKLESKRLAPFSEVAESINTMAVDLSSVETLRKEFIGDFSHEFKTPIVSINGFAKLLLEEDVSEEERREYLQIIADESARLSTMSMQTMLLSKLDTQTKVIDKRYFSLDEQIKQKIILLSNEWEKKNIEMDVDLEALNYYGNPEIMSHVWVNLLNNAIKFTPEGGYIAVDGKVDYQGNITVKISDTGKGIEKDKLDKIFFRYYQGDSSHSTKGLGLGLSIVARIMDLCQGKISVESTEGEGSTFIVYLPVVKE